jgi:hypothetical protein
MNTIYNLAKEKIMRLTEEVTFVRRYMLQPVRRCCAGS